MEIIWNYLKYIYYSLPKIHLLFIKSEISSNDNTANDYIISINSINTILYTIEDTLVQQQNSIKLCNEKRNEMFYLKPEFERQSSQNEIDKNIYIKISIWN